MCDSFVALPPATAGKSVILAKSADCRVNEAHALVHIPRRKHQPGEMLLATHIMIPQVEETFDITLSRSFWTWGAEIGINEYGVAIGNEAVYSTLMKDEKEDGLITMDLLRVGLERSKTARQAVEIIGDVVHRYGQGGNCEVCGNSHFDTSLLVADTAEAWIIETAGREWAAKKAEPTDSISNAYTIRSNWELCSLSGQEPGVDWNIRVGDHSRSDEASAIARQQTTYNCLKNIGRNITIRDAFDLLRYHPDGYHPTHPSHPPICMHAAPGENYWNACGAMASEVSPDGMIGWFTGTSGTCTSIFKPVFPGFDLPDMGSYPCETFDPQSMWWIGELLHRRAMADFDNAVPAIRKDFEALEDRFILEARSVIKGTRIEKQQFMEECFRKAAEATSRWIYMLAGKKDLRFADPAYGEAWARFNREAGLTGMPS